MMYSFDEIGLLPKTISTITSRKEVNPYKNGKLPIFVAPMTCLIDANNIGVFQNSAFIPIYPIFFTENVERRLEIANGSWVAVSLKEFKEYFVENPLPKNRLPYRILIDCAQGHMKSIFTLARKAKEYYGTNLIIMAGNIANPNAYDEYCKAGIDYVRVGIGGGSGCLSSVLTGIHASLPYLLTEIIKRKIDILTQISLLTEKSKEYLCLTRIVADGGVNNISKIMKSLALGADYVMMGSMFANCEEIRLKGLYYGQASESGQIDRFGKIVNEPEGCSRNYIPTTDLATLAKKIEDILRSTMSYAGAKTLNDFIGKVRYEIQTINEFNSYNK